MGSRVAGATFPALNTTLIILALVYIGMFLGRLPGLAIDRTGVALLGAIALVAFGGVSTSAAWTSVDVPTKAPRPVA
jgi:hypothetical protein